MDKQTKNELLYKLNVKYNQLEYAIQETEFQLASVNKRLRMLSQDLVAYLGMIVLPGLLFLLLLLLPDNYSTSLILIILTAFRVFLGYAYVFSLPFTIANLIKSIALLLLNSESRADAEFSPPIPKGVRRGVKPQNERTYRIEQKKLTYVLSRYYLSRDALDELNRQLECNDCEMTLQELNDKLNQYPLYEDIKPANVNVLWKRYKPLVIIAFVIVVMYLIYQTIMVWN